MDFVKDLLGCMPFPGQQITNRNALLKCISCLPVHRASNNFAITLRISLLLGRKGCLAGCRSGFGQLVDGIALIIDAIRHTGHNRAEKIEGFAQLGIREGQGRRPSWVVSFRSNGPAGRTARQIRGWRSSAASARLPWPGPEPAGSGFQGEAA